MTQFNKTPQDSQALVNQLIARGMSVPNQADALRLIRYVGYYRLSGYALLLETRGTMSTVAGINLYQRTHSFRAGVSFQDLTELYELDRSLRIQLFSALERIEVALRNEMCNYMAIKYNDAHWYLEQTHFNRQFRAARYPTNRPRYSDYDNFMKQVTKDTGKGKPRRQTTFCAAYFAKYTDPDLPPVWMVAEQLTMGTWSKVFEALDRRIDRKNIADYFDASPAVFASWLHALSYLRNICAHHKRILGINFVIAPSANTKIPSTISNTSFAMFVAVIHHLLNTITPHDRWVEQIYQIIQSNLHHDSEVMLGFPDEWFTDPFWH